MKIQLIFLLFDQESDRAEGCESSLGLRVRLEPPGHSDVPATKIALGVIANDCDFQYQST